MKKNYLVALSLLIVALVLVAVLVFLRGNEDTWICQNGEWVEHGHPDAPKPATLCPGKEAGLANPASVYCQEKGGSLIIKESAKGQYGVCVFSDGSTCEEWSFFRGECALGKNVALFEPTQNETLTLPFTIAGSARVFENMLSVRIKSAEGDVLFEQPVYANSTDVGQFGDFQTKVSSLNENFSGAAVVEAFWHSPKDGAEIDLVSVPVEIATP